MTNKEAIETIKANYPDERYTMLREALDMAMEVLEAQEPLAVRETRKNKCVCGNEINRYWHPEFCGFCGNKLLWF